MSSCSSLPRNSCSAELPHHVRKGRCSRSKRENGGCSSPSVEEAAISSRGRGAVLAALAQEDVREDAKHPAAKRAAVLERAEMLPGPGDRLCHQILGIGAIAGEPQCCAVKLVEHRDDLPFEEDAFGGVGWHGVRARQHGRLDVLVCMGDGNLGVSITKTQPGAGKFPAGSAQIPELSRCHVCHRIWRARYGRRCARIRLVARSWVLLLARIVLGVEVLDTQGPVP